MPQSKILSEGIKGEENLHQEEPNNSQLMKEASNEDLEQEEANKPRQPSKQA